MNGAFPRPVYVEVTHFFIGIKALIVGIRMLGPREHMVSRAALMKYSLMTNTRLQRTRSVADRGRIGGGNGRMDILDTVKSAFKLAQSLDNIELQKQVLEIQEQAMDLQQENIELKNQINEMKRQQDIESRIERHADPYITLKDDPQHIAYCATCWATKHQLIQMYHNGEGILSCPACKNYFSSDYKEVIDHRSPRSRIG